MNKNKRKIEEELNQLREELENAQLMYQNVKDELENFLSQFTCVLDAPSCGCSEDELNDPKFEALYTEQDRLTKLSKTSKQRSNDLKNKIATLETELGKLN